MLVEIPVCKRCCFCLPLRYGLIVSGYIKLILGGFRLLDTGFSLYSVIKLYAMKVLGISTLLSECFMFPLAIADFILSIVLLIGCHKKNLKLMKSYYRYAFFLLTFSIGLSVYSIISYVEYSSRNANYFRKIFEYSQIEMALIFLNIFAQIYLILLVRSEIKKLESGYQFRFVNNAAEAECTLNTEHIDQTEVIEEKKNTKDENEIRIYV